MNNDEKQLSEKESLALIATMINKAKDSYHDTGISAMMWGALIAVCALVKFSEINFNYRLPFDIYLLTVAAIIPQIYLTVKEKRERKVKTYDDAYMDYIWLGFGVCIVLLIFIVNVIFSVWEPMALEYSQLVGRSSPFRFGEFTSSFFLLLYGLPTFITGAACRFRPMLWGGILCWICCIITVYTNVKVDMLLTAVSAIAAWFLPGLVMEKEYRIYKRKLAAVDV